MREASPEAASGPSSGTDTESSRPRVLIVDDEESVRAMLVELLSDEGFECVEAPDGERALQILDQDAPSLGVLDLALPGISGAELAWRIRERWPEMPLIALSGQLGMWDQDDLRDLGFARVFSKPMDCDEFLRICRETGGAQTA